MDLEFELYLLTLYFILPHDFPFFILDTGGCQAIWSKNGLELNVFVIYSLTQEEGLNISEFWDTNHKMESVVRKF